MIYTVTWWFYLYISRFSQFWTTSIKLSLLLPLSLLPGPIATPPPLSYTSGSQNWWVYQHGGNSITMSKNAFIWKRQKFNCVSNLWLHLFMKSYSSYNMILLSHCTCTENCTLLLCNRYSTGEKKPANINSQIFNDSCFGITCNPRLIQTRGKPQSWSRIEDTTWFGLGHTCSEESVL